MTLEFSRVTLPPLWTVEQAKVHLHITGSAYDADIQQKVDAAQEAVLAFLGRSADATWTAQSAPLAVTHSIHLLTAYFYRERGDGSIPSPWPIIYELLGPYRDPVLSC